MGDGQPQIFSVRIVSIDYYMTPPIPGVDISYSSLQGGQVREVPVIRIYGPTPAGQKACLHIHQVLPYLYIPCSDLGNKEVESCAYSLCLALDKALKTKANAGSKHQHVHSCEFVRAKKFYGYHSVEELFVKIYFYYPQDVPRAANILLAGAVLDKSLQPYESHIPFLLQFLVDYNLYGMSHLHVSKLKFRCPIPDNFCRQRASQQTGLRETKNDTACRDFTGGNPCLNMPVWISSTIPDGWVWRHFCQPDSSTNDDNSFFRRQSTSELEGDALVDDVINQQFISYTPLSQTLSDVKMVQSLIPIWQEEYERNGAPEGPSPDSARPLPQDVLKILSDEPTLEQLSKVGDAEESCPHLTPDALESLITNGNFVNDRLADMENNNHLAPKYLNASEINAAEKSDIDVGDKMRVSSTITPSSSKVADEDALRLLKWFSSSQAGEDIDSDDELARETVLSPLFPKDIDKMLERANIECERESQKECQDILDSILMLNSEELTDRTVDPRENNDSNKGLLDKVILQVDGSSDDVKFSSGKSHQIDPSKAQPHAEVQSWPKFKVDIISESKGKRPRWGSLPISSRKSNDFDGPDAFHVLDGHEKEKTKSLGTLWSGNQAERFTQVIQIDEKKVGFMQGSTIHECSVRDLMRRKRSHQLEQPDDGSKEEVERAGLTSDAESEKGNINPDPDFQLMNDAEECKKYDLLIDKPPLRIAGTEFPERGINFTSTACKEVYAKPSIFYSPTLGPLPFSSGNNSKELGNKLKNEIQNNIISCTLEQLYASKPEIVGEHIDPRVLRGDGPSSCTASLPQNDFISKFDDIGESSRQSSITKLKSKETAVEDLLVLESKTTGAIETRSSPHDDQYFGLCDPQHTRKNLNWEAETVGLVPMTFSKTPPSIDWTNEPEDEVSMFLEEVDSKVRTYLSCRSVHNYLPFFSRNCAGEELPVDYVQNEDLDSCPVKHENIKSNTVVGVPINQQNDGSSLFMLSPALSPPTWESIGKWLSFNGSSPSSYSVDATSSVVAKGSCVNITDSQCSQLDSCNALVLESASCSDEKLNFSRERGSNQVNCSMEVRILDETGKKSDCLPDVSQISGPEKKTGQTPLSQTGFRDPASDGQGQQLTLMSIEVQAETRDNLRPDPRFDAVNIITVVCQDDDEPKCDALVLLRCNSDSPEKDMDAISEAKVFVFIEELQLLNYFKNVICAFDPDVVMGWDVQSGSLGFLAERAAQLGLGLLSKISRTPSPSIATSEDVASERDMEGELFSKPIAAQDIHPQNRIIDDEWGRTHASGVHVGGRIVLNIWRLLRNEVNLNMYTIESVAERVLRIKIPYIPWRVLTRWFASGPGQARFRSIEYTLRRAKLNLQMLNQLDMVNRTSELARVFGIDFFSVLSRGSQYRVESMLLRLAHTQNYLAISPGNQQVVNQPAMECLPLVMEPESSFYADPVIVLDFQSLYPSMVIAYNLCFCTCLGKITPAMANALGVSSYVPDVKVLHSLRHDLLVTPNGVMYVPSKVRKGILPMLLEEILSTRIMVKQAMKKLAPYHLVRQRILNARQLALKLIANVTYGYTAAGFSGRMPCAELADSIVQCGRRTLEAAISFVNSSDKWKARVIYGDTDSMFVLLKGRSLKEAFEIGREIAAAITAMNPNPIMLKMEKVYYPCFLLTKKRYVGYSYESPEQAKPIFDAKGIETVRRDTCGAVSKMMEQSLRIYFESNDIDKVKAYVIRQCTKILTGRVSLQDFIFAKEVRLGTYSERGGSLPPAAIVATKSMRDDPRAEPRYGERVPYVVVHGEPGARLVDMVVDPYEILDINSPFRLNETYYITKQMMPALQRAFGLVGADLNQWFSDMPRPSRESVGKGRSLLLNPQRTRIDYYYTSRHCILCGDLVHGSSHLCHDCSKDEATACLALTGTTSKLEKDIQHLVAICRHCGGGDWRVESGVKCISLSCPVFFERRKVQKELQSISQLATANGFYPKCITEWF